MKRKLSRREVVLLVVLLCLAVIALFYSVWLRPELGQINMLKQQVTEVSNLVKRSPPGKPKPNTGGKTAPKKQNQLLSQLPTDADEAGFLQTLASVGAKTHVQIASIQAQGAGTQQTAAAQKNHSPSPRLPSLQVKLQVVGTSNEIEAFLAALRKTPRLTEVTTMTVQGGKGQLAQANLDVLSYYAPGAPHQ